MPSVGYLGPPGTFTEEALEANLAGQFDELIPFATVPEVLLAVESGQADKGIVPIENSIEGSVNVTVDTLTFETDLLIEREIVHQVRHELLARGEVARDDICGIVSIPHAAAQCRKFLAENFGGVPVTVANSTAEAAQTVSKSDEPLAAIATEIAAQIYGLVVLERDIADYRQNMTRFVLVGKDRVPLSGNDKTSVICFIHENRPGSLLEILAIFASRQINLTKIESRPTKKALGEYCFFIDFEGHIEEENVSGALGTLEGMLRELKMLGSYPAASTGAGP